jgi:succinate dehydrogenase flavin-adding protein (antitoxin of CptAB toxin-antitoxin module)
MTPTQIEELFNEVIQEKAIYNKLEGITRNNIFNWINNRTSPTKGDMLNVLYQLNKIDIKLRS